jgi:anti-sigma factor RsiW
MSDVTEATEAKLHAYVDGELLEPEEGAAFEVAVAADEKLAARVAAFRADKARLAQIYGRIASQPLPPHWIAMIEGRRVPGRSFSPYQAFAAIAATLLLLIGGPLVYRQMSPHEESIVEEALAARNAAVPVDQVADVRTHSEGTAATRAISTALAMRVRAPDLSHMGYKLVGFRIYDRASGRKAAELYYRHRDNRMFALYLRRPSGAPRFDQYRQGNLRVCIWQDDVLGAVMTGEMSAAEMQRLASLAYTGLES